MKDLEEIKKILKKELPYLKEKYKVKKIGIFGSYIRGENKKQSDIDILVEFYSPIGWDFFDLQKYLGNILETKIDLVTKNALKPFIGQHILKEVVYL